MRYEYRCDTCGKRQTLWRYVEQRNNPVPCHGHGNMRRVLSSVIINANLRKDRPELKYVNGFSATDKLEFQRKEAKESDALCARIEKAMVGVKEKPDDLADIFYGKV